MIIHITIFRVKIILMTLLIYWPSRMLIFMLTFISDTTPIIKQIIITVYDAKRQQHIRYITTINKQCHLPTYNILIKQ